MFTVAKLILFEAKMHLVLRAMQWRGFHDVKLKKLSFGFLVSLEEIIVWNHDLKGRSDTLLSVAGLFFFIFLRVRGLIVLFSIYKSLIFFRATILFLFVRSNI